MGADLDPIAAAERLGQVQRDPGQDIAQNALEGQAQDGGKNGRSRQEGRDIDAESALEDGEQDDEIEDDEDEPVEDTRERERDAFPLMPVEQPAVDKTNGQEYGEKNDRGIDIYIEPGAQPEGALEEIQLEGQGNKQENKRRADPGENCRGLQQAVHLHRRREQAGRGARQVSAAGRSHSDGA